MEAVLQEKLLDALFFVEPTKARGGAPEPSPSFYSTLKLSFQKIFFISRKASKIILKIL